MKSNLFNILYRVCDSCENYNSVRITGKKKDVIVKSFISLINSIELAKKNNSSIQVNLHVVYDKTSIETKTKLLNYSKEKNIDIIEHSTSNGNYGNMASFKLCYEIAKTLKGYIFFLEDDYLLDIKCIDEMFWFLNRWDNDSHICLKPHHEVWAFTRDQIEKTTGKYFGREVLLGKSIYWFRDKTSTCTFLIDDFILERQKDNFEKTFMLRRVMEDYLNEIWKVFPLFSSILSLGIHFHSPVCFPPFFLGATTSDKISYTVNECRNLN